MPEYRFQEVERDGRELRGVVMPYGSLARISRITQERFSPKAFGDVDTLDVLLNVQHDRRRPLARTGGEDMTLIDNASRLFMRAKLPETQEANDALTLLEKGVFRGLSVEFDPVKERYQGNIRNIEKATLTGIGLVDRPAYANALVSVRAEIRQLGMGLTGAIPYNVFTTISDSGSLRKEGFDSEAFTFGLQDESREVSLIIGDYSQPLGSLLAGSLILNDTPEGLEFRTSDLPDTSYARDFQELMSTNAVSPGVQAFYRLPPSDVVPNAYTDEPEPGNEEVLRRRIHQAILTAIAIQYRAPRDNPGILQTETNRRRKLWL